MKILSYVEAKNSVMYKWQEYHIHDELKRYGIDVEVFDYLAYGSSCDANHALLERIAKGDIDLFTTSLNEKKLFIDTLDKVKNKKIPTLLICSDNLVIPFHHKKICRHFDLVWLTSIETEYLFKRWGAKTVFLPYAANPYLFDATENGKVDLDKEILKICFVGTPYGSRVNSINSFINNGIPVDLFSNYQNLKNNSKQKFSMYIKPFFNLMRFNYGRKVILGALINKFIKQQKINTNAPNIEMNSPVSLDEIGSVYSGYALSLSSTVARNTGVLKHPLEIVNLRSFEIPMAGGIQVCKYNKELANYFEDGKEIVFYTDEQDMINKVQQLLLPKSKAIRDEMRIAARKRAENEHSWFSRYRVVFDYFKLDYKGK